MKQIDLQGNAWVCGIDTGKGKSKTSYYIIPNDPKINSDDYYNLLLKYTSLEKENEELKRRLLLETKLCNKRKEEKEDYKSRCKRAIEIIDIYGCYNAITEDKLYSCLRGGNKNEKLDKSNT